MTEEREEADSHLQRLQVTPPDPVAKAAKLDRALLDHARAAFAAAMQEQEARRGDNVIPPPS